MTDDVRAIVAELGAEYLAHQLRQVRSLSYVHHSTLRALRTRGLVRRDRKELTALGRSVMSYARWLLDNREATA